MDLDLEGVRVSEVSRSGDSHADPHVVDLGGHVAEGQVADHHLLSSLQFCHATRSVGYPGDLMVGQMAERLGNRAIDQKVAGLITGCAK